MAKLYMEILAELRAKYPEDNLYDRIDKSTQVLTLRNAESRLAYTLRHGSLHPAVEKETEDV